MFTITLEVSKLKISEEKRLVMVTPARPAHSYNPMESAALKQPASENSRSYGLEVAQDHSLTLLVPLSSRQEVLAE